MTREGVEKRTSIGEKIIREGREGEGYKQKGNVKKRAWGRLGKGDEGRKEGNAMQEGRENGSTSRKKMMKREKRGKDGEEGKRDLMGGEGKGIKKVEEL